MSRDFDYEEKNKYIDEGNQESIKCKNHELCGGGLAPDFGFYTKSGKEYLCINCDMMFGTCGTSHKGKGVLPITDNLECSVCFETKRSIEQPNCKHTLCIDCFKRCYYKCYDVENEPIFPYPDIEDEYYDNQENSKWDNDYPLIKIYNEECNKWHDKIEQKYKYEKYLRKCPLCRE